MKKVLVVVDMQNDFVSGALASPNGPDIVDGVAACVDEFDGDVFYTLDTHYENYLDTQEGTNLPVPHCVKGTDGWKVNDKIQAALDKKGAKAFEKLSFGSPDLATHLVAINAEEKIDEIVLVGICTDICVLTNSITLKTFLPETVITVIGDLCAGVTKERHDVSLEAMKFCQINVI